MQCVFTAPSHTPSDTSDSHLPHKEVRRGWHMQRLKFSSCRLSDLCPRPQMSKCIFLQRIYNWYLWFYDNQNNSSQHRKRSEPILNHPQNTFNLSIFPWTYSKACISYFFSQYLLYWKFNQNDFALIICCNFKLSPHAYPKLNQLFNDNLYNNT